MKPSPDATCRHCGKQFRRPNTLAVICSPRCAIAEAKEREKSRKASFKARKEAIKTRSDWMREAQAAFNAWVRRRDAESPCISCGRFHDGQWHAGHFLSVGSHPELRFDERNCHKQCQPCNTHKHGNLIAYRSALIERIGPSELDALENSQSGPRKYTIDELKAIKAKYRALAADLAKDER